MAEGLISPRGVALLRSVNWDDANELDRGAGMVRVMLGNVGCIRRVIDGIVRTLPRHRRDHVRPILTAWVLSLFPCTVCGKRREDHEWDPADHGCAKYTAPMPELAQPVGGQS